MQKLDHNYMPLWNKVMLTQIVVLIRLTAFSLMLAIFVPLQASASSPDDLQQQKLRVGLTQKSFLGANTLDVEAAYKSFVRIVGVEHGYNIETSVLRFKSAHDLASLPPSERPNIIIMDSWSYLEMNNTSWLEPMFVTFDRGQAPNRYLLLTQDKGTIKKLDDLRGQSLNVLTTANANLSTHWLQALLEEHKLGTPKSFFGTLEYHTSPLHTALPVFFGKKKAAVVNSIAFELMAELNPQLNRLQVLAASEPLVNAVICFNRSGWTSERFRQDLIEVMFGLHLKPAGQQILTLFKVEQIVPFKPNYLKTVHTLYEKVVSKQKPLSASGRLVKTP